MTDAVPDEPRNVLLVGATSAATEAVCIDLLTAAAPADTRLLSVVFDKTPDYLLGLWRARHGELPARTAVIEVGGETRSTSSSAGAPGAGEAPVSIVTVGNAADLTGLSIAISNYLDAWADDDLTTVVGFHSLSSWLSRTDEVQVFKFLQTITGQLREIGARTHFHIHPDVHGEGTINRFASLMDAVVRVEPDGGTTVKRRRRVR